MVAASATLAGQALHPDVPTASLRQEVVISTWAFLRVLPMLGASAPGWYL